MEKKQVSCSDQIFIYERFNSERNQSRVMFIASAAAFETVYNWVNEFKRGRTSTCDAPRSGRSIEAATPEIIDHRKSTILF